MTKTQLDRRTVLRGIAGGIAATVALPRLEAMLDSHGTAFADGSALPRRFGLWFWGNGVQLDQWIPSQTGAVWTPKSQMQPLAPFLPYVTVVSGTETASNGSAHHEGYNGNLTGSYDPNKGSYGGALGPSFDQVVAKAFAGQAARYDSLQLGVSRGQPNGPGLGSGWTSRDFSARVIPAEQSPQELFNTLFGKTPLPNQPTGPTPEQLSRVAVNDLIREQAKALQARLGTSDRQRMDSFLDGVSALEKKVTAVEAPNQCQQPAAPGIGRSTSLANEALAATHTAMADLLTVALACDLTRVFSIEFTCFQTTTIYSEIGLKEQLHALTHDEARPQVKVGKAVVFTVEQLAYLVKKLHDTPEGAGNLLDNSCICATSEVANGYSHSTRNIPILLIGKAGGKLRAGIHHQGNRLNTARIWLTAMNAVGANVPSFGVGQLQATQQVSELLTSI